MHSRAVGQQQTAVDRQAPDFDQDRAQALIDTDRKADLLKSKQPPDDLVVVLAFWRIGIARRGRVATL